MGSVRLHRREFDQESYYDVPALRADPRFRDSMRLIEDYSLLAFMTRGSIITYEWCCSFIT